MLCRRPLTSLRAPLFALTFLVALSAPALADEADDAAAAYDRGALAHERGDNATAAREFARADELAPNPIALESALKAALLADTPGLGMELVERAQKREVKKLKALIDKAHAKFEGRAGKLALTCPVPDCSATVDHSPFPIGPTRWIDTGAHTIAFSAGARSGEISVEVAPGASVTIARPPDDFEKPEPTPTKKKPTPGLSPIWFWSGVATTGVLTIATIASGADTLSKNSDFQSQPTPELQGEGIAAQTRTNILVGVTAAAGIATAALGVFAFRVSPSTPTAARQSPPTLAIAPTFGGAQVFLSHHF